jgi:membrane associated rhomboid family serine protease
VIPLKDHNPAHRPALVTWALMAVCIGIYFFIQPTGQSDIGGRDSRANQVEEIEFTLQNASIPCEITQGRPLSEEEVVRTFAGGEQSACQDGQPGDPAFPGKNVYLAIVYSMFLHGGLLHLAGNMLYLFVFGNNIEDQIGKVGYALFYLASGVAATLTHVALDPASTVPMIGASGAIAGVMGAYAVAFPRVQIRTVILFVFIMIRDIPAAWLLGFWFVSQFFVAPSSGVAWAAHAGGFAFGALAGLVWRIAGGARRAQPAWRY